MIPASRAGFGVLALGENHKALSRDEGAELLLYGFRRGIVFFDTARYYRQYPLMRSFLAKLKAGGHKREEVIICSKALEDDYGGMQEAIKEAADSMETEYIDIFLMHEVRSGQLEERSGAWQALTEAKERGLVRKIGISTHHSDVARKAAELNGCDCVLAILNIEGMGIRTGEPGGPGLGLMGYGIPDRQGTREEMEEALYLCSASGLEVYIMKVLGGGNLTADYMEALDYAFSRPFSDRVLLGMGSRREVDDLTEYMSGQLDRDYKPASGNARLKVNREDCVGCGQCMRACASSAIGYGRDGLCEIDTEKCVECGYCAYACPVRAIIRV